MNILAIETSCDETAVAILEITNKKRRTIVKVLGNALLSQTQTHAKMGGVVPMLAKREHQKNLLPLLILTLKQAGMLVRRANKQHSNILQNVRMLLEREEELRVQFEKRVAHLEKPGIDAIAVTYGPGLEPALWVGINFAKALSLIWKKTVIPVNHMEGHIVASLLTRGRNSKVKDKKRNLEIPITYNLQPITFPLLALLISGGHTELVVAKKIGAYKVIGETRDDAVGEAFDKVARMLGLPYPGGPQISKLAEKSRNKEMVSKYALPRPMLRTKDCDFSFAGLKTAVLYTLKKIKKLKESDKREIALEFENAVADVLAAKTARALTETKAKTFVIGGGVSANKHIRRVFAAMMKQDFPYVALYIPDQKLTTDNAVMIGLAGYFKKKRAEKISAQGNLRLR